MLVYPYPPNVPHCFLRYLVVNHLLYLTEESNVLLHHCCWGCFKALTFWYLSLFLSVTTNSFEFLPFSEFWLGFSIFKYHSAVLKHVPLAWTLFQIDLRIILCPAIQDIPLQHALFTLIWQLSMVLASVLRETSRSLFLFKKFYLNFLWLF